MGFSKGVDSENVKLRQFPSKEDTQHLETGL